MITYKPVIIPGNKRKDGTYPLKIRVTFAGKSRRLPTTMVCTPDDLTRSLKIKNATILERAGELIKRMRATTDDLTVFDLEGHDVDWVVSRIRLGLAKDFRLNFFEWAADYCSSITVTATRRGYITAVNTFARFVGSRDLDVNAITRRMLLEFRDYVDNEPKISKRGDIEIMTTHRKIAGKSAVIYLIRLQTIYQAARSRYNDEDEGIIRIPRTPFEGINMTAAPSKGQRNLGRDLMQQIIDARPESAMQRMALDVFIVSFALMGANMADLYPARVPSGGVWTYFRAKTQGRRADRAEMRVNVPDCISPHLARLRGSTASYWLGSLHKWDKDSATRRVNTYLAAWCRDHDVPVFTLYAARHTFASLARAAGVEKSLVDECLAHVGAFDLTDIYAERPWQLINEAAEKVRALFSWPEL